MKTEQEKPKKSLFISGLIRPLTNTEQCFFIQTERVVHLEIEQATIGYVSTHFSYDSKPRPLILHKEIVRKIHSKHGNIPIENMLINTNDWDIGIKNMDNIPEKINLIKIIPNSKNFLLIGALQQNGYFIVTHFEVEMLQGNELKSLLGRGDSFSRMPDQDPYSIINQGF